MRSELSMKQQEGLDDKLGQHWLMKENGTGVVLHTSSGAGETSSVLHLGTIQLIMGSILRVLT